MGKKHFEKNYDDQVYEDEYYEEHYNEEELSEESESPEAETEDDRDWDKEKKIVISFACEDCDYRWEDQIIKPKDELLDEEEDFDVICPMCGSINITQI